MKFLIVGLGNSGAKYKNTRHNIGFDILRSIALDAECDFVSNKRGSLCKIKYKGKVLVLLLPNTFMNLSGKAVNYWLKAEKIEPIPIPDPITPSTAIPAPNSLADSISIIFSLS